ncbi:MAG: restriction endonuclease [Actinobacteria bacterium]|nr:MAG: restriction endonuclease [Actinomycetota bacterium]
MRAGRASAASGAPSVRCPTAPVIGLLGMAVWTVKAGRHGEREERCLEHSVVGGRWGRISDLSDVRTRRELNALCEREEPEWSAKTRANYVAQLWSLRERMLIEELVVLPLKTTGTVAVGRISGPYAYRTDLGEELCHVRPVSWIKTDLPRDSFDQDLLYSFGAFLTVGRVRRDKAEERILAAASGQTPDLQPASEPSGDDAIDVEAAPDPAQLAREQIRQRISQTIAGHDLAYLVGAIFEARGFSVTASPPGADGGIDLLMGSGPTGRESPRIVGQVKTGQAGVDDYRAIFGLKEARRADQGLLVAWGGFRGNVKREAQAEHFSMALWDADDLLDALFGTYEQLREDMKSRLPLKRTWTLVLDPE